MEVSAVDPGRVRLEGIVSPLEPAEATMRASAFEQACLQMTRGESTEKVREAERYIRTEMKRQGSLQVVLRAMAESQEEACRQLGSILLRRVLASHWVRLVSYGVGPESPIQMTKRTLLNLIVREPNDLVRRAHVAALAVITQRLVKMNELQETSLGPDDPDQITQDENSNLPKVDPEAWSDVVHFMVDGVTHQQANTREAVMVLYGFLAVEAAAWLAAASYTVKGTEKKRGSRRLPSLQAYTHTLQDPEVKVRRAAYKSMLSMLEAYSEYELDDEQHDQIEKLIPIVLHGARVGVEEGDKQGIETVIRIIDTLLISKARGCTRYFTTIVETIGLICGSDRLDLSARKSAAEVVGALLTSYGDQLISGGHMQKLVEPVLKLSCDAMSEGIEECQENSFWLIFSQIPENLPVEQGLSLFGPFVLSMADRADANIRAAGVYIMGHLVDGIPLLSTVTDDSKGNSITTSILPKLIQLVKDPDPNVQFCALRTLRSVTTNMESKFPHEGEQAVATALELFGSNNVLVSAMAARFVSKYIELAASTERAEQLAPIATPPALRLARAGVAANNTIMATSGLSIATALSERMNKRFKTYVEDWMNIIRPAAVGGDLEIRAAAIQILSQIALTMGREAFSGYIKEGMRLGEIALGTEEDPNVQSAGMYYFATMCEILGMETRNAIPNFIPYLINSITNADIYDNIQITDDNVGPNLPFEEEKDEGPSQTNRMSTPLPGEDPYSDRINHQSVWQINANKLERLSTAILCLDYVCSNAPEVLRPHVMETIEALFSVLPNPTSEITVSVFNAISTVFQIGIAYTETLEESEERQALAEQLLKQARRLVKTGLNIIMNDQAQLVSARGLKVVEWVVRQFGREIMDNQDVDMAMGIVDDTLHSILYSQQVDQVSEADTEVTQIKPLALSLACTVLTTLPPSETLERFEGLDRGLSSYFQADLYRPSIIRLILRVLMHVGTPGDLIIDDKINTIIQGLRDNDFLTKKTTALALAKYIEHHPNVLITAPVRGKDRTGPILEQVVEVASYVPYSAEGEQVDRNALTAFKAAMLAALWMFVGKHTQIQLLNPEILGKLQSAEDGVLYGALQTLPFESEAQSMSFSACRALHKLLKFRDVTLLNYLPQAVEAIKKTVDFVQKTSNIEDEEDEEDLGTDLRESERERLRAILTDFEQTLSSVAVA